MTVVDLNSILSPENFDYNTYHHLVSLLNENETWKKIADYFGIFSEWEMRNFTRNKKPVEKFLYELGIRLCTIEIFCNALEKLQLNNILMLFKEHLPLQIIQQTSVTGCSKGELVKLWENVKLQAQASGIPPPQYQWFHNGVELEGKTDSELCILSFSSENEGEYYCIIDQVGYNTLKSNTVGLMLAPECPVILKEPSLHKEASLGSEVTLIVQARGHPKLNYQWYKGNQQLDGCVGSKITFTLRSNNQYGTYRCYIYNSAGEVWSQESTITPHVSDDSKPTAKLALLISNQFYENLSTLYKPENDVKTLSVLFKKLGFFVMALQNLNLIEMRNAVQTFANLLLPDAYVVFYFAGHGFEIHDKLMLPVDAPGPDDYLHSDGFSERELLKTILSSNPKVFVELLDMCLKPPNSSNKKIFQETPSLFEYQANSNLIQGYSTTSNLEAFEKKTQENGLYVEHFKKYLIGEGSLSIVEILKRVGKDVASVSSKQKPFFGTNVIMDYRFSDPCDLNSPLKTKFDKLLSVPENLLLSFRNVNVVSSVTFSMYLDVFLNTLEIRLNKLTDYRVTCEALGNALTFKLCRDGNDLIIKVMNLQRLIENKTLKIILTQNGLEVDRVELNIGKPLIGVADLWEKQDSDQSNKPRR